MATNVEESDTDDDERPAPPKRQCTRLSQTDDASWQTKDSQPNQEAEQEAENPEFDDAESRAREKLKRWQACQTLKGFVDNVINRVLEIFIRDDPWSYPAGVSRGNEMEDAAVMMAIRNYGLIQSNMRASQSHTLDGGIAPGYLANVDRTGTRFYPSRSDVQPFRPMPEPIATTSTDSEGLPLPAETEQYNSDWPESFLERAVAEAIKKKGLSALSGLSVDYG